MFFLEIISIPVNTIYNKEALVIEGIPSTIDIELTGSKSRINKLKDNNSLYVTLDLSPYIDKLGKHTIEYTFTNPNPKVDCKLLNKRAKVTIYEKVSSRYEIINLVYIDKENIHNKIINKDIIVRGSQKEIDKIAKIEATLNTSTTTDYNNIPLIAYDKDGNKLSTIEIVPSTITEEYFTSNYTHIN